MTIIIVYLLRGRQGSIIVQSPTCAPVGACSELSSRVRDHYRLSISTPVTPYRIEITDKNGQKNAFPLWFQIETLMDIEHCELLENAQRKATKHVPGLKDMPHLEHSSYPARDPEEKHPQILYSGCALY